MALTFEQHLAATYDKTVLDRNKSADQWSDSSFLMGMEETGGLERVSGGDDLKLILNYRANPAAGTLATDTTLTSTTKTEVLTMVEADWAIVQAPINWSFRDEDLNTGRERRIDLVSELVDNALTSHDDVIEDAFFAATATDGLESLFTLFTEDGTGTVHGVVSGTETWWKSQFKDWASDTGATLLADYTTLYNSCAKGSSGRKPNIIVSSATMHAAFEAALTPNQRYANVNKASGGFTEVQFKTIPYLWSSAAGTGDDAFMFNTRDTKLYVVRGAWRKRRTAIEHTNALMMNMKTYSILQFATKNRSRGGRLFT
jgi:hypothetical protein